MYSLPGGTLIFKDGRIQRKSIENTILILEKIEPVFEEICENS